uniref:Uncharacterized protein n=1 Tax=Anguilla anguilla TaxID=7936 RepID=A0A0E9TV33_ANGAN
MCTEASYLLKFNQIPLNSLDGASSYKTIIPNVLLKHLLVFFPSFLY